MPRTSSLGDLARAPPHPRVDLESVPVSVAEDVTRYERCCTVLACVALIGCGVGVGVWASL